MLRWAIGDLTGAGIPGAEVDNPLAGSQVVVPLNGRIAGKLLLSFDDPAAGQAYPLVRIVKCWLDGEIVAAGPIMKPRFDMQARTVEIPFVGDPSYRLERSFVNNRLDTNFSTGVGVMATQTQVLQGEIVARLMEHAKLTQVELDAGIPNLGIARGTLQSGGVKRDRTYETGAQVWQQMLDMTGVIDGIDLALTPLDRTDGVLAKLDTFYPQRGFDRSRDVRFEYGLGVDNCTQVIWEPAGDEVINRATVQGVYTEGHPPLLYQSNQFASQVVNGIYQSYEARSDVSTLGTLVDLARDTAATHAFAPDDIEITPAMDDGSGRIRNQQTGEITRIPGSFGRPPYLHPSGDYWLGDTVGVTVYDRPTVTLETKGRVYELTLTEDGDGAVLAEVKVTPSTIEVEVT